MRLSSFLPLALIAATASFALALPTDASAIASRGDSDLSLSARDLDTLELLAREYIAEALIPRSGDMWSQPRREQFRTHAEYEQAFLAWNRRNRKIDHSTTKQYKKLTPQPQREHYASQADYQRAYTDWNRQNRKVEHSVVKTFQTHQNKYDKQQAKASGSGSHPSGSGSGSARKPSLWQKVKKVFKKGRK